ncbi:hypothetical protein BBF96_12690 [Anoxybacter fermentans]|uniref:Uncharacterized protein n=1 Tax=Anoxybacter fermentans TaxID=1323375 RepID=A0A3Q9HRX4_9FIRM|nr:tetratricopeptide repeat protein [Anoxybacter fermentans]AZR74177.1 hypothetical protein BBF96_12690 [Anoxybacter fermentans]
MIISAEIDLDQRYELALDLKKKGKYVDLLEVATENAAFARYLSSLSDLAKNLELQAFAYYKLQYYKKSLEKFETILSKETEVVMCLGNEFINRIKFGAAIDKNILGDLQGAYQLLTVILDNSEDEDLKTKVIITLSYVFQYLYQISNKEFYVNNAINFLQDKIKSGTLNTQMLEFYKTALGIALLQKKETNKALKLLTEVLNTTTSDYIASHAMNELAWLYIQLKKYDQADEYLNKAYEILKNVDDKVELARNYFLRGLWYKEQNQYERAEYYLKESANIFEEKQVLLELLNVSYELFKIYERVNPAKAAKFFVTCEKIREKIYTPEEV